MTTTYSEEWFSGLNRFLGNMFRPRVHFNVHEDDSSDDSSESVLHLSC